MINDGAANFSLDRSRLPPALGSLNLGRYTSTLFADVNGDHLPDLVLPGENFPTPSAVFLNSGGGYFFLLPNALPSKPFGPDASGIDVAPLDLNADAHIDLAISWTKAVPFYEGRWIQLLVNNGDGTFRDETATRFPQVDNLDAWTKFLVPVDFDSDGDVDVVAKSFHEGLPNLYLRNTGSGLFHAIAAPAAFGGMHAFLDIDYDGGRDIVTAEAGRVPSSSTLLPRCVAAASVDATACSPITRSQTGWALATRCSDPHGRNRSPPAITVALQHLTRARYPVWRSDTGFDL